MSDQMDLWLATLTCGTCGLTGGGSCLKTRYHRRKVPPELLACTDYREDLSQRPLKIMTLRELGFRPEPKVSGSLQLLGFRDSNLKIGVENE